MNIETKVSKLEKDVASLKDAVRGITTLMTDIPSTKNLAILERDLLMKITEVSSAVRTVESKLSNVILPDETRFYLEYKEVEDFRKNFKKLLTLVSDIEEKFASIVSYVTKL